MAALEGAGAAELTGARRADLLADVGDAIEGLAGRHLTGPDVRSSPQDLAAIGRRTDHVLCRPERDGGSGDSSGPAAAGVIAAIEAVCADAFPGRDPSGLGFAVIGLGRVGHLIGEHLAGLGARLVVSDADPVRRRLADTWGAEWIDPATALSADVNGVGVGIGDVGAFRSGGRGWSSQPPVEGLAGGLRVPARHHDASPSSVDSRTSGAIIFPAGSRGPSTRPRGAGLRPPARAV